MAIPSDLVDFLLRSGEMSWIEFKENNSDPERIAKYISALCNSAAVDEVPFGYLLWGISDSRSVVGTTFNPSLEKRGNQSLKFWLSQQLDPTPNFEFIEQDHRGRRIVIMRVEAAHSAPVRFDGRAFVRVGDATPELGNQPALERRLWSNLQSYRWEDGIAAEYQSAAQVLSLLDFKSYFRLMGKEVPDNTQEVIRIFYSEGLLKEGEGQQWNITNLAAILFAENISNFSRLSRKAIRVVRYEGNTKLDTIFEQTGSFGYAKGFEALIAFIDSHLPKRERIGKALRTIESPFSELSIRELVANALIHQDMTISGAGPMVEIFDSRLEITNPGRSLIDPSRFIDYPPRSRNEGIASLMRRMNICEERGSGIDKVVYESERFQLPPPDFTQLDEAMRVTLYGPRPFSEMTPTERVRACYQHACLKALEGERATNASLRDRLGIGSQNAAQVSRVLKLALDQGLIKLADSKAPRAGYVPWWS